MSTAIREANMKNSLACTIMRKTKMCKVLIKSGKKITLLNSTCQKKRLVYTVVTWKITEPKKKIFIFSRLKDHKNHPRLVDTRHNFVVVLNMWPGCRMPWPPRWRWRWRFRRPRSAAMQPAARTSSTQETRRAIFREKKHCNDRYSHSIVQY